MGVVSGRGYQEEGVASGWIYWWLEFIGVVSGWCCKEPYRFPQILVNATALGLA